MNKTELKKRGTSHVFRHSYAILLLEGRTGLSTIQESLGHSRVRTTEIYTHVMKFITRTPPSILDDL